MNAHRYDPCFKCGTPHDEVKIGPCPGPTLDGYRNHVRECQERNGTPMEFNAWFRWIIDGAVK